MFDLSPPHVQNLFASSLPQDHLSAEDHRQYRQTVGQLIWASLIRPDLQYPAKTLTHHLQAPTSFDLKNLKHTLRYIKGTQHLRLVLGKDLHRCTGQPLDQLYPLDIKCYNDSDWARDQETRKSTSGFIISIFNTHCPSHQRHREACSVISRS